jgi:hypothetical protein
MWKDWLERTLTRNKAPVMLAAEIMCVEPANNNESGPALPPDKTPRFPADDAPERVGV